jgi:hypothetical protein
MQSVENEHSFASESIKQFILLNIQNTGFWKTADINLFEKLLVCGRNCDLPFARFTSLSLDIAPALRLSAYYVFMANVGTLNDFNLLNSQANKPMFVSVDHLAPFKRDERFKCRLGTNLDDDTT